MLDLSKCLPIESFAAALAQHASALGPHHEGNKPFFELSDLQKRLAAVQMMFIEEVKKLTLAHIDPIIETCKEYPVIQIYSFYVNRFYHPIFCLLLEN